MVVQLHRDRSHTYVKGWNVSSPQEDFSSASQRYSTAAWEAVHAVGW